MEEEKNGIEVDDFKVSKKTKKKSKFAIKYLIYVLILVTITAIAIYITIDRINKNKEMNNSTSFVETKKEEEDKKYLITSYAETYNSNSIKITKYYDEDGTVSTENSFNENTKCLVEYVQISGLKDKKIQSDDNKRLKDKAYGLKSNNTYSSICGDFSNILSVVIFNNDNKYDCLNVNLATGKEIKLEDLFLSSTPLNSYLVDSFYEANAWQSIESDGTFEDVDMSKVDLSDFEDRAMLLINNYNKKKDNLAFGIQADYIYIYGLGDERIVKKQNADTLILYMDLTKYMDSVTLFKKFLTKNTIFEDDSIGFKNTVVFTEDESDHVQRLNYGKIKDNVFMEEIVLDSDGKYYTNDKLEIGRKFIQKLSSEAKSKIMNDTNTNKGVFVQREYQLWYDEDYNYTAVNVLIYGATCPLGYFKNEAFLDYIKLKNMPREDIVLQGFNEYMQKAFPNLNIDEQKYETYYLNDKGEIFARSYEELEDAINKGLFNKEEEIDKSISTNTIDINNTITNNVIVNPNTLNIVTHNTIVNEIR